MRSVLSSWSLRRSSAAPRLPPPQLTVPEMLFGVLCTQGKFVVVLGVAARGVN